MSWDFTDMKNLEGKVAIVTGANSGLGYETAKALAEKGAEVVMGCRDRDKAYEAMKKIDSELRDPDLRFIELDLAELNSINRFSIIFKDKYDRLDLMVNNAGVMHIPFKRTEFGFEYHFGVNHLGHFALNSNIMDLIEETENSRVISVSSLLHKKAKLKFDQLNSENNYDKKVAYADSKMANLMYAKELDKRFKKNDIDSKAFAVHPGYAATNLQARAAKTTGGKLKLGAVKLMNKLIAQSAEKGALPTLYACSEDLEGGEFIGPSGFKQLRGSPEKVDPDPRTKDKELQQKLWEFSEDQLEIHFKI